jgi:hypothetical protein
MKNKYLLLKNNKSINFLNSLINSDFLILEKLSSRKNNRFLKSNLKSLNFKKKNFSLLNFFELIKMFRQCIRILQFFKNAKSPTLFIDLENDTFLDAISFYIKHNKSILPIRFKNNILPSKNLSSFMILLDKLFTEKNNLKQLINLNILIFIHIDSSINSSNNTLYRIFNSFDSYKKLIFFLIFLKKFYSNKNLCV